MNIYEKLQQMRVELQDMNIKKSGRNKFANYDYYELADILPPINKTMEKHKVCSFIAYNTTEAVLTLVNSEAPDEVIVFTSPMAEASLKGTHPIQNLGAVETYQRRYLYMTAFEIVENDFFDATQGGEQQPPPQPPKAKPQARAKAQPTQQALSADNGDLINRSIKYVCETTGKTIKEVTQDIEKFTHKPIKQLQDKDVEGVMSLLNDMALSEYIEEE